MKVINSITNPYIIKLNKLKSKKYRDKVKLFLIEGYHLVSEALQAKALKQVLIIDEKNKIQGVENILVNRKIIEKLSQTQNPQNIIGVCDIKEMGEIKGSRFLLLDDVSDPGNLGTLIRTALGFNIDQIILSENSVDLYNDKVIRATQGALFKINIIYYSLPKAIQKLKNENVYIIGSSLKNAKPLRKVKSIEKYAIILGNESLGIKDEILDLTDVNVKIEINEKLESLNVAIAGAILMYYFGEEIDRK
ncbi:MAG TPA: RNA methyltransferase [Acholeplasmataceae bacterium]|jgi:TrmH family RNA methyltransferase|nr:RNA methyltransferase [Acholeplasmataceae bacterium]